MANSGTDLVAKLPSLEDSALSVLHENAERLEQAGTPAQKTAASALIPAIKAELADRRAAKLAELADRRAAKQAASKGSTKAAAPKRKTKPKA